MNPQMFWKIRLTSVLPLVLSIATAAAGIPAGIKNDSYVAARKKAIVAVACQLATDLWRIRTGLVTPEQLGLSI